MHGIGFRVLPTSKYFLISRKSESSLLFLIDFPCFGETENRIGKKKRKKKDFLPVLGRSVCSDDE